MYLKYCSLDGSFFNSENCKRIFIFLILPMWWAQMSSWRTTRDKILLPYVCQHPNTLLVAAQFRWHLFSDLVNFQHLTFLQHKINVNFAIFFPISNQIDGHILHTNTCLKHSDLTPTCNCELIFFLVGQQPDDDHMQLKHVANHN